MSRVSVIVPAFNASRTIAACVESIRRQNHRDLEIIVVDDGSADGTADIVRDMPGVRLLRQENAGPGSARNRGIEAAIGEWLAFLDSDEEWIDAGKLESQLACARMLGAVLVGTRRRPGPDKPVSFRRCLLGNPFATSSVLAAKEAVLGAGLFEEGRSYSEDYLLWLRIVALGGKAALAGVAGSRDLRGRKAYAAGGLSSDLSRMQEGEERNFRTLYRERLLARTEAGNLFRYMFAMGISRAKFLRRLIISSARIIRRLA